MVKPKAPKPVFRNKKFLFLILISFLSLGAGVYFGVSWYQGYKFKQVEKKMEQLQAAFIQELGPPFHQSKTESCSYASAKFRRGRLSCAYKNILVYGTSNIAESDLYTLRLQSKLKTIDLEVSYNRPPDSELAGGAYESAANTLVINGSSCRIDYFNQSEDQLRSHLQHLPLTEATSQQLLVISSLCAYTPWRPFFPITES